MTDRSKLLALAEAVENLSGPDREVDALIWCRTKGIEPRWTGYRSETLDAGEEGIIGWLDPGKTQNNFQTNRATTGPGSIPAYTASLDAAMSLVTGHAVLMHLSEFGADGLPLARVGRPDLSDVPILPGMASCVMTDTAPAAGMAIALTAAALRAQAEALA